MCEQRAKQRSPKAFKALRKAHMHNSLWKMSKWPFSMFPIFYEKTYSASGSVSFSFSPIACQICILKITTCINNRPASSTSFIVLNIMLWQGMAHVYLCSANVLLKWTVLTLSTSSIYSGLQHLRNSTILKITETKYSKSVGYTELLTSLFQLQMCCKISYFFLLRETGH